SYVTQGLGRIPGVGAAFTALLAYNVMQIGLVGGFGAVLGGFIESRFGLAADWWVYALAGWLVVGLPGILPLDLDGRFLAVRLVAEIAVAIVFAVVQVSHPAGGSVSFDTLSPSHLIAAGIGAALVTAIAGFVGFEATAVYAEESKNPRRTVPTATY